MKRMFRFMWMTCFFIFFYLGCCPFEDYSQIESQMDTFLRSTKQGILTQEDGTTSSFELRLTREPKGDRIVSRMMSIAYASSCPIPNWGIKAKFKSNTNPPLYLKLTGTVFPVGGEELFTIFLDNKSNEGTIWYSLVIDIDSSLQLRHGTFLKRKGKNTILSRSNISSLQSKK